MNKYNQPKLKASKWNIEELKQFQIFFWKRKQMTIISKNFKIYLFNEISCFLI